MKYLIITLLTVSLTFLSSCGFLFNEIFLDDQCKRCEVINRQNNEVLWSDKGCGGKTAGMEKNAKIEAYEISRNGFNLCNLEVICETWTTETEDTEDKEAEHSGQ